MWGFVGGAKGGWPETSRKTGEEVLIARVRDVMGGGGRRGPRAPVWI